MIIPRFSPSVHLLPALRGLVEALRKNSDEYSTRYINLIKLYFEKQHVVLFPQARVALYSIMKAIVPEGGEVIIAAYNVPAVIEYMKAAGVTLTFIDSEPNGFNIDIVQAINAINENTKAILISHMYGKGVDFSELIKICQKKNIVIIEDSAQAFGSKIESVHPQLKGRFCGTAGDIGVFSTGIMKKFSTVIGGFVITDNELVYEKIKKYKAFYYQNNKLSAGDIKVFLGNLCIIVISNKYIFSIIFFFFKKIIRKINTKDISRIKHNTKQVRTGCFPQRTLEKYQSIIGIKSFQEFGEINKIFNRNTAFMEKHYSGNREIFAEYYNFLHYPVIVRKRGSFIKKINRIGADAGPGKFFNFGGHLCPNADNAARHQLNIPLHHGISEETLHKIIKILDEDKFNDPATTP